MCELCRFLFLITNIKNNNNAECDGMLLPFGEVGLSTDSNNCLSGD